MNLIIDDSKIEELEKLIIEKFKEFRGLFKKTYKADIFGELHKRHIDPIWTCYINGRGQGYKVENWEGIFPLWIKRYLPNKATIIPESWYRIDYAVVDDSEGGWWEGKYQIFLIFEQENNPLEIKGHTRQFYDFNTPEKILLTWTNDQYKDPKEILNWTDETINYCKNKKIKNIGEIIIIVGDWEKLNKFYTEEKLKIEKPILTYKHIPSEI